MTWDDGRLLYFCHLIVRYFKMDVREVNWAQFDVLCEHIKRFVCSNRNSAADIQLKEAAERILSSIAAYKSYIEREKYYWQLYDLFPIFIKPLDERREIQTAEDLRDAAFKTGKRPLKLSIDWTKCSLGNLVDLTSEFTALKGRLAELKLIGNVPAEFAEFVDLMEPQLLHPTSQVQLNCIKNLRHTKRVAIDFFCSSHYPLIAAILDNPTVEVFQISLLVNNYNIKYLEIHFEGRYDHEGLGGLLAENTTLRELRVDVVTVDDCTALFVI